VYLEQEQVSLTESKNSVTVFVQKAIIRQKGLITVTKKLANKAINSINKALLMLIREVS
jgi:hypothetical protein